MEESKAEPAVGIQQTISDNELHPKTWVKFEEDRSSSENNVATIIPTESIQLDSTLNVAHPLSDTVSSTKFSEDFNPLSSSFERRSPSPKATLNDTSVHKTVAETKGTTAVPENVSKSESSNMCTIPLRETSANRNSRNISQGFNNGDVIVNLLPVNDRFPWITKAKFKPELVPEELMAQGLTLTVEDYVMAMQVLVNDLRFNMYIICYKRVLIMWIVLGFIILLSLLFSGVRGLALFGGGIVWLIVNAVGIFVCMWLKIKLYRMLEQCFASVNALLYKHRILLGLDDRGKISCHKVNLIFVYFDVTYCIKYLKDMLENEERITIQMGEIPTTENNENVQPNIDQSRMDIDTSDIIITGSNKTKVSQKEKYAEKLFLRYSQRWVKEYIRKRLDLRIPLHTDGSDDPGPPTPPRHCATARCPCQFIEEHLKFKPFSKCNIKELFS